VKRPSVVARIARAAVLTTAMAVAAAVSNSPARARPAPDPPASQPPVPDPAAGASASTVVRLTLAEAVDRAREYSPRLAQLRSLEDAAAAGTRGARAQRMPVIDLSAGYTRRSDVPEFSAPDPAGGTQVIFPNIPDNYRTRLGFSLPIYTGGRLENGVAAAGHEQGAAAHDVESGVGDTALETRAAYWDLVAAREEERVLREAIASYEAHLKDTRDREQAGMAARNDVLAVQVDRDRAELARLRAANAAEVANANLIRVLGLPDGARVDPADPLDAPEIPPSDLEALVAHAFDARPERAALKERIAAADARAQAQRAGTRPQASLQGGYDYSNPNRLIVPNTATWQDTWDIGVSLSFTLFDAGRTSAAFEQASAQAQAARRALEDLDRRIRLEVTARYLDLTAAATGVEVADRAVEAGTENVRVSQDRYQEGLISSTDRLDAETGLLRAGLDRVQAMAFLHLAIASLERAVGS
jgi:outer membrane protein TolC